MVYNLISRLKLDGKFHAVDLKNLNDCYLIAIKEKENKKDTIKVDSVRRIRFEIAIDSGLKDKPLTIQYVNLNFDDITSGKNEINKITAFTRLLNIPSEFYIRAITIDNGLREIETGETAIMINVNALDLGD